VKYSRYSGEQISSALQQAESGTAVEDVCRELGFCEATFYLWKKKYANLGSTEIRELWRLREENAKLKRLVVDLWLGKYILAEVVQKRSKAATHASAAEMRQRPTTQARQPGAR
jgi:putative transposase